MLSTDTTPDRGNPLENLQLYVLQKVGVELPGGDVHVEVAIAQMTKSGDPHHFRVTFEEVLAQFDAIVEVLQR